MKRVLIAVALSVVTVTAVPASSPLSIQPIGTLKTGLFRSEDPRVAEINAYDPFGRRIYIVNPQNGLLDVMDVGIPTSPVQAASVNLVAVCQEALADRCPVLPGAEPNSVAIHWPLMAVAVANAVRTDNGHAMFFLLRGDAPPIFLAAVQAGALPDMITFSDLGRYVLVANEGEPNQPYTIDPRGSVTIIDTWFPWGPHAVRQVGFEKFDAPAARAKLVADGVRIFGPGASTAATPKRSA